jgi:valyl-tRNA synthetase
MLAPWPQPNPAVQDSGADADMTWLMAAISAVRNIRGEMNLSPGQALPVQVLGTPDAVARLQDNDTLFRALAKISAWQAVSSAPVEQCATAVVPDLTLYIPLAGLIDLDGEVARLAKSLNKIDTDLQRAERKLANPGFLAKAHPDVVEKERAKTVALREQQAGLQTALNRFEALRRRA